MGNFSGETVVGRTGSSIPARIAAELLSYLNDPLVRREEGNSFTVEDGHAGGQQPSGMEQIEICALSGMPAGPFCPGTLMEWSLERPGTVQRQNCDWHRGGEPLYPPEYQSFLAERFRAGSAVSRDSGGAYIRIPPEGSVFFFDPSQPADSQALRIETAGFGEGALVYANGVLMGTLNRAGVFVLPMTRGRQEILVEDGESRAAVGFVIR
jgi:penicillin-binding protein 1C